VRADGHGLGLFLAEKFVAIIQLVQLDDINTGEAAFVTGTPPDGVSLLLLAGLLLAPLALHAVTATISSLGARRSRGSYAVAVALAMTVHFAYNYMVVITLVQ
jgi:hypothetical protein